MAKKKREVYENVVNDTVKTGSGTAGIGVRKALTSMGLNNERIGFNTDTGMVTYDGREILKPDSVIDGTSYADEKAIQDAVIGIYGRNGNPLVSATDYGAGTGIDNLVQWRDGYVSIGGELIKPVMVRNGKAFVTENSLNSALNRYKSQNDIKSGEDVYNDWYKKYGSKISSALNEILNREEWAYDPYSDPAYLSYKDAYEREGKRAYQDAAGSASASTGGYTNSAAIIAGGQQLNYYMQQLNDKVPELMQNDYERYAGEQKQRIEALESLLKAADDDFDKRYKISRDTLSDVNRANNTVYQRDKDSREWNDEHMLNEMKAAQSSIAQKLQRFELAKERDYFTDEDIEILDIPVNDDGTVQRPSDIDIDKLVRQWENYGKKEEEYKYDRQSDLQREKYLFENNMLTREMSNQRELLITRLMYGM